MSRRAPRRRPPRVPTLTVAKLTTVPTKKGGKPPTQKKGGRP